MIVPAPPLMSEPPPLIAPPNVMVSLRLKASWAPLLMLTSPDIHPDVEPSPTRSVPPDMVVPPE